MPTTKFWNYKVYIITLNSCLFVYDQLCDIPPNTLSNYFKLLKNQHKHNTRGFHHFTLNVPRVSTETYGSNSVKIKAIKDWNNTTKKISFTLICFSNKVNMLDLSKHLSRLLATYPILTSSVKQFKTQYIKYNCYLENWCLHP